MTNWRKSYRILPEPIKHCELVLHEQMAALSAEEAFSRSSLLIDTIHDGDMIPDSFWESLSGDPERRAKQIDRVEKNYVLERDWGANMVAAAIVDGLRGYDYFCPGYFRINIARVLMDYGRFPGNTPPEAAHLDRFAINYPFSEILNYRDKKRLLETYYDNISERLESLVLNKQIKIAIHTYDKYNRTGTLRPLMSILTRPLGYQTKSAMPQDFFDPLYPAVLCEYTADRRLTYRLSLMLEKQGYGIAHNYPYNLPDGSIEVRSQVWFFFQFLRKHFEEAHPDTAHMSSYQQVWAMLLDTNLRSTESENLRSYLHMFRKAPKGEEKEYSDAQDAYTHIRSFLQEDNPHLVQEYRFSPNRPSSIGIEVRKDHVWEFADEACRIPLRPKEENARQVGQVIADALMTYFTQDANSTPEMKEGGDPF